MSDTFTDDDQTPDDDAQPVQLSKADLRQLREAAKKGRDAEARASTAEAKLSIYEAGLTGLNARQIDAVLKTADATTTEGLQAAATELGFWEPPKKAEDEGDTATPEEKAVHQRMAAASAGAGSTTTLSPLDELTQLVRSGASEDEFHRRADELGLTATTN